MKVTQIVREPELTFGPCWLLYTLPQGAAKESSRDLEFEMGQEDTKGTTKEAFRG